jgi:hypothetical protein
LVASSPLPLATRRQPRLDQPADGIGAPKLVLIRRLDCLSTSASSRAGTRDPDIPCANQLEARW